jgi:hypothetical protein
VLALPVIGGLIGSRNSRSAFAMGV